MKPETTGPLLADSNEAPIHGGPLEVSLARAVEALEAPAAVVRVAYDYSRWPTALAAAEQRDVLIAMTALLVGMHHGDLCLDLADRDPTAPLPALAALARADAASGCSEDAESIATNLQHLGNSGKLLPLVDTASSRTAPLRLEGSRLYATRLLALERRTADLLNERAGANPLLAEADAERALRDSVAHGAKGKPLGTDQEKAVRSALALPLLAVTGGPGSGKTTFVGALVAALVEARVPPKKILLAAPTGKAAHRLGEALAAVGASTEIEAPKTLHRLLDYSPRADAFGRGAHDPLDAEAVIVDEASMLDARLATVLLEALPKAGRLILVGDGDQLPSVEAGSVFRELITAFEGDPARRDRIVRLGGSYRFQDGGSGESAIARLAAAVRDGADLSAAAVAALGARTIADFSAGSGRGVEILEAKGAALEACIDAWAAGLKPNLASGRFTLAKIVSGEQAEDAAAFAARAARFRILSARREGRGSTGFVNDRIVRRLYPAARRVGGIVPGHGMPVVVVANDYGRGLWNGDVGIVIDFGGDDLAHRYAVLVERAGCWTPFLLQSVSDILEPAFALTVHKSQGSEVEHAAFILPERDDAMLRRELVYTAITRARSSLTIVGPLETLAAASKRGVRRASGLAQRLSAAGGAD